MRRGIDADADSMLRVGAMVGRGPSLESLRGACHSRSSVASDLLPSRSAKAISSKTFWSLTSSCPTPSLSWR